MFRAEASLIVPDFTISVYGTSYNHRFFGLIFVPCFLFPVTGIPIAWGKGWQEIVRGRKED